MTSSRSGQDVPGGAEKKSRLQALKEMLASRGLAPQKKFGQNFMVDTNFALAVARDAAADQHTLLIEIGPGTGCLTQALLDSHPASRVLAVEIDRGLAALLRETFAPSLAENKLTLIEGDALASKHELSPQLVETIERISTTENRPRRVLCANLPYNAATPLLANMAVDDQNTQITSVIATVQLELAQRLFADPNKSAYGALTVLLSLRASGGIVRRVGGEVFWPRPRVESAVIKLDFKPWPEEASDAPSSLKRSEAARFQTFLQTVFSQRRKTLRAVLRPAIIPESLGLPPDARAEALSPETILKLFRALKT
ncbi:MAG TPA: 16S rRNA (adenine(1518)-N(6)/adenine(1519)-N(6))-dimethyltransferase RsmA [Planctomycetota bacterium]|nr:16S rRNA (adenine(1518)-N(6)/adenine(1519)-N(6))-dimethyltransferase RsmA [Planctomycetota bacterium]